MFCFRVCFFRTRLKGRTRRLAIDQILNVNENLAKSIFWKYKYRIRGFFHLIFNLNEKWVSFQFIWFLGGCLESACVNGKWEVCWTSIKELPSNMAARLNLPYRFPFKRKTFYCILKSFSLIFKGTVMKLLSAFVTLVRKQITPVLQPTAVLLP